MQYLFHISKKIYDYNRLEKGSVATLIMSIDGKELDKICTVDYQHDPQQEHNVNFIIDRDGYILAYPDLSYAGEQMSEAGIGRGVCAGHGKTGGEEYFL